jgi:hypothetical protein
MTHHAYYIEGPTDYDRYAAHFSPLFGRKYERFGVEEARRLIELATLKNYKESTFLIVAASMTTEAQQALLKMFEEPQEGTRFVLVVPHGTLLLTLKSRMLEYPDKFESGKSDGAAEKFLSLPRKERSEEIAALLKDDENVRERVREFLAALEQTMAPHIGTPAVRKGLEDIAMVRGYLSDRSPSLKMLLEHLALSLPRL